jgi:thiol:disulfide interchange protein
MSRLLLISASFCLLALNTMAQNAPPRPVKWFFTVKQVATDEAELVFTAKINEGYHVYSQDINPDVGPIPTTFVFNPDKTYALSGKVSEGKATEIYDPNFEAKLKYFSGDAVFVQRIKTSGKNPFEVSGTVTYMVCDEHRCYPPEDLPFKFSVNVPGKEGAVKAGGSSDKVK